jgi:hypothetical protein
VRLAVISSYPPYVDGFAEEAAELTRTLAADHDVVVCAVGRRGLAYPDEVVAVVAADDPADYRRAAAVLVEYGVDTALIRYEDGVYGGPAGSHVLELAAELRRHGVALVVSLPAGRRDLGPTGSRTVAALTAGARSVLVPTAAAGEYALARRIATPAQVRIAPVSRPPAVTSLAGDVPPHPVARRADVAEVVAEPGPGPIIASLAADVTAPGFAAALAAVRALAAIEFPLRYVVAPRRGQSLAADEPWLRVLAPDLCSADQAAVLARTAVYLAVGDDALVPRAAVTRRPVLAVPDSALELDPARLRAALRAGRSPTGSSTGSSGAQDSVLSAEVRRVLADPGPGPAPVVLPAVRTDWLVGALGGLRSFQPDRDARLAVVAAGLLGLPPDALSPAAWSAAQAWAGRAVRALGVAVQVGPRVAGVSRAVWGLGAVAGGLGVADASRHRAGVLRAMLIGSEPTDLAGAADVVLGLAHDVGSGVLERSALAREAARLRDARRAVAEGRGGGWPCFAERLRPGDIRLAHALVVAGDRLGDDALVALGVESVDWMARRAGLGSPGGTLAPLVPVAIEAGAYVDALAATYRITGAVRHIRMAQQAMAWFHGANPWVEAVYDAEVGACRTGLGPAAARSAYSVEATLAYLSAALVLRSAAIAELPAAELARQDLAAIA